jgi:hypothetical protein
MVREGSRKKKRKFHGNRHVNDVKKPCVENIEQPCVSGVSVANLSASARKIGQSCSFDATSSRSKDEQPKITGYRFIDEEILSELFQQMPCKLCGESSLSLEDDPRERKGCASHLRLRCDKCGWVYTTFFTS